jgi:hypothetical protein
MSAVPVDELFEEFVASWVRGEQPDLNRLLSRAGGERDQLARLVDEFLARAPRREPTPGSIAAVAALTARLEDDPPLLAARLAARQRVRDVVVRIVAACGLPAAAEESVQSYYQRLEGGLLDPRGVSDKVWSALESLIPKARNLATLGFPKPSAMPGGAPVFKRAAQAEFATAAAPPMAAAPAPTSDLQHEVDRLFTGRKPD